MLSRSDRDLLDLEGLSDCRVSSRNDVSKFFRGLFRTVKQHIDMITVIVSSARVA